MRIRTSALIALLLAGTFGIQAAAAEDFLLPYDGAYQSKPGFMEVVFSDSKTNYLESTAPNRVGDSFNAVFPACSLNTARNCIESVQYKVGDGDWQSSQLSEYVQTGMDGQVDGRDANGNVWKFNNFPEDKKSGTPAGGKASTWILGGAPHEGGNEYLVSVTFNSSTHFSVNLLPIKWGELNSWNFDGNTVSTRKISFFEFPKDVTYRVKIHLGVVAQRVNSWFFGRLTSPQIELSGDLLSITAKPGYSSAAASDYFSCGHSVVEQAQKDKLIGGSGCSYVGVSTQHEQTAFSAFKVFEPYLHQWKYQSAWSLDSQDSSNRYSVSAYQIQRQCGVTGIAGVSVTNALIMQSQVPSWDASLQELSYNIASTHLDMAGMPNIGTLELALNEQLAKCLWGATTFKDSQAKISVTYENGEKNTTTSVSNVRNGWMYLKVDNFTFSTPKIVFSIVVPPAAKAKPESSIKCINGKKTLTVAGKSPICPPGYKRK